jgi:hypothetical protein
LEGRVMLLRIMTTPSDFLRPIPGYTSNVAVFISAMRTGLKLFAIIIGR